ncbi:MAG TPA: 3-hydroxyacyl-CoA dehydrogenase NAD-binding domain-containing protein [Acidobacteriaceae bacterium]|jgi:3-hydroxybutyryl-CoA dehydrogenase
MPPARDLRRIAVIGAGTAGRDLALRSVRAGFQVTLEDVMPSRLRSAQQSFATDPASRLLRLAATVEDAVRDADLAIDFVPDELESKLEIFSMLDRMAPPHTILCTPTRALSIADLASCTYRPQLCFGVRFEGTDAELVRTHRSSPDALSATGRWLTAMNFSVSIAVDASNLSI